MYQEQHERFLGLLQPIHVRLWRFVFSMAKDYEDAQDLMSETVLVAFERFETLRDPKAFPSFLFTIATRIFRYHERKMRRFEPITEAHEALESLSVSPEHLAEIALIKDALKRLPDKQRETVILFEVSGFTLEEIREIQGGTLSGVKSRLRRGRATLAKMLGVEQESERDEPSSLARIKTITVLALGHE